MKKHIFLLLAVLLGGTMFMVTPFLFEILAGTMLFTVHFVRKPDFEKRLLGSAFVTFVLSLLTFVGCYATGIWPIKNVLCYLLQFVFFTMILFACYEEQPIELVFSAVSGYMVQHIASQFSQIIWRGESVMELSTNFPLLLLMGASRIITYGLTYFLIYYFFLRHANRTRLSKGKARNLMGLAVTTLLVVTILSGIRDTYAEESFVLMLVSRLFSVFCCVFLLYLRWGILERGVLEQEREELLRLHAMQRSQYEQNKENIELINIKCHDLKHRVAQWERQGGRVDPEEIRQVREMIGIYDSVVKTGNETLDILLTERSLYCEQHGIRLSCMVDGSKLSVMSVSDICALFGNALENAIEAVSKLENPEDRIISFQVRQNRGMLVVTVDNYFTGDLTFREDLPRTTKEDHAFHGYGLKSIRMVAEKYGGQVTLTVDEMFHLTVLLPLPENS